MTGRHTDACGRSKIEDARCVECIRTAAEHDCGCMATTTLHPTGGHDFKPRAEEGR